MTTLAVAAIAAASAACWWPVARALARRIERGGALGGATDVDAVRARLAALEARVGAIDDTALTVGLPTTNRSAVAAPARRADA